MQILQTDAFALRLRTLRDHRAQARIARAVERMAAGNLGDVKSLGDGLFEARIHYGPGYRLYLMWRGSELVVLLLCGSKSTQVRDIAQAKLMVQTFPGGAETWPSN